MSKKIEDLSKKDATVNLDEQEINKLLGQEEVLKEEQEKVKTPVFDARGERVKAILRRKKLDEMGSKYMNTFYNDFNRHIKEIDKDIKPEVTKKPNIIKRFFGFIIRLFSGKKKNSVEALKVVETKDGGLGEVEKLMGITQEEIEKYSKEIEMELQQAVQSEKAKKVQVIEEIINEQNKEIERKL